VFRDAKASAAQRVTANGARPFAHAGTAGKSKRSSQVRFFFGAGREQDSPFGHFDQALAALAILAARGRNADAAALGALEERRSGFGLDDHPIDLHHRHGVPYAAKAAARKDLKSSTALAASAA
jgi:hypothetical protein